ncbi:MAG TPA: alkaline phosphatase D family protein [Labilithrix sp.]|nr:alkaline phosphatase D family protein [Labilithrix sp.]
MKRREFLLGSIASVFYVACGSDPEQGASEASPIDPPPVEGEPEGTPPAPDGGRELTPTSPPEASDTVFPQGLASGDPRPDRVLLWTRVDPTGAKRPEARELEVSFVIAEDEALTKIVGRGTIKTNADVDHTVRVVPTNLQPGRFYYYRFESEGTTTRVGRTKTAPADSADVPVKFAFCSCQDYIGRYWHSWKALLDEKPDLDFILWLGDYIYESVNDGRFQTPDPDRAITLPDGIDTSEEQDGSRIAASTLADYRALYKAYRSEPLLREVHRLYPFILTWDDHEFADDCWGDHSTSFNELDPATDGFTEEKDTPRRQTATRAFSEYQPADVTYNAKAKFPNDIQIYRQLRYGKHVDIFMTDQRMYRSDHVIPEGPADLPVGKPSKNSSMGSRYVVRKSVFDEREDAARPTLLGTKQKEWFLDAVKKSPATWKVWGNEVQLWQMALKLSDLPSVPYLFSYTVYVNADQWDGFRTERAEILHTLAHAGVQDLVVFTGDIHAFFASEIHIDFDNPAPKPVAVEYVTAGISSASLPALIDKHVPEDSPLRPVAEHFVEGADKTLMTTNPHLRYSDTDAYGFALVDIDASRVEVTFVKLGDPREKTSEGVLGRKKLVTKRGESTIAVV